MSILSNFFESKKTKSPLVKIRAKRSMILNIDGETRQVDAGQEIEMLLDDVRQLDRDDFQLLTKLSTVDVADPSPAREEPAPMPERWETLPKSFAEYWNIAEAFRVAKNHITAIEGSKVKFFGFNADIIAGSGKVLAGSVSVPSDSRNKNMFSSVREVDLDDPILKAQSRFLNTALTRATEHLEDLKAKKFKALQQSYFESGQHLIQETQKLNDIIQELGEIGIAIFGTRIHALGLAEWQVKRLYAGSADCQKYSHQLQALELVSGGFDEHGVQITYIDRPMIEIAGHLVRVNERIAELEPLLEEGRKELARTRKASAA